MSSGLRRRLAATESSLREIGLDLREAAAPGVAASAIADAEAALGYKLPIPLQEFFGWHNGRPVDWFRRPGFRDPFILPGYWLISLEEAVQEVLVERQLAAEVGLSDIDPHLRLVPILQDAGRTRIVARFVEGELDTCGVDLFLPEEDFPGDDPIFESIEELIEIALELIRGDHLVYDPSHGLEFRGGVPPTQWVGLAIW